MNKNSFHVPGEGVTLITASRRLARYCRHAHARAQLERGRRAWPSPDILPWQAWLQRRWEERAAEHADLLLLHPYQEQVLWQQIIAASPWAEALLHPANVAQRAMQAWALLRRHRVAIFPPDTVLNHDARAFKSWADVFEDACRQRGWCDTETMLDVLADDAAGRAPGPGGDLVLLGFERLTPQQQRLLAALEARGRKVVQKRSEGKSGSVPVVSGHADAGAEIRAAAEWARARLEEDAGRRIGIVIPDLHVRRGEILRQFEDCLAPGRLAGTGEAALPFSLAPGRPLNDYPVIAAALSLLSLCAGSLALAELGSLLRSPYLAGEEEERVQRARLDARLRDYGEVRLDLRSLRRIAAGEPGEDGRPRRFLDALAAVEEYLHQLPRQAAPLAWAGHISRLLALAGWPGGRELDSGEYQTVGAWREALDRFVSLQLVERSLDLAAAVRHLRRIAAGFSFQPQTPETPVQIMGLAGAADMAFDHLWVAGLGEESWPPPAQPNPYIPLALQRRHAMPGAAADLCLAEARETLERLLASAGEVVLSYPQNEGERGLRPSPLLRPFASGPVAPAAPLPDYAAQILAGAELQAFTDDRAPPLADGHRSGGGTGLFRDQSVCPFRAFARYRLHAAAPEEVDIGLGPRDRGLILHRVLHLLWQRLGSQERLEVLEESAIEAMLAAVIDDTVERFRRRHPLTWTARFTALEKARLNGLLRDWLAEERRRAPFEVIACELEQDIVFEGLAVRTRLDRIDRLADGGEVIIDYKTGEASVNEWLGERPDDPQLPLYAVTREAQVAGVAFARLKRGRGFGYQGLARDAGILPGTEDFAATRIAAQVAGAGEVSSWEALLADWRATLARLARGFCEGDARVDPKSPQSCRYCDQHALCRIHETRAGARLEADGDD
jgi:ATP-dependent helicase/nuclease subunit B